MKPELDFYSAKCVKSWHGNMFFGGRQGGRWGVVYTLRALFYLLKPDKILSSKFKTYLVAQLFF